MDTTPEKAAQVIALIENGLSQRAVAVQLDMTRAAVRRVFQRYEETGSFHRRPGTGRKRFTTARDDRFIVSTILRNRHLNAVQVQQQLREVRGVVISQWTVRRRLKENNLTSRVPAIGQKLTPAHRQARLRFARDHLNWTLEQWGSVLFSDETRICLYGSDRRRKVYRRPGERFAECCIEERSAYGGGSCMIWGAISMGARTDPVFIRRGNRLHERGGLTGARYIEEILAMHVVPYVDYIGDEFIFMHDNARPHTARIVQDYITEVGFRVMEWPACSPDLNPIEHLWDELKQRIRARLHTPNSIPELIVAVEEEWLNIPQETIANLIRSMPNRMRDVINARGGHTHY